MGSEISPQDLLIDSELRLFRHPSDTTFYPSNWTYSISVHQILPPPHLQHQVTTTKKKKTRKLCSLKIGPRDHGWLMFNITSAVQSWINDPADNHGLIVRVRTDHFKHDLNLHDMGLVTGSSSKHDVHPFLLAFVRSAGDKAVTRANKRPKRESGGNSVRVRRQKAVSYWDDDEAWNPRRESFFIMMMKHVSYLVINYISLTLMT